MKFTIKQLIDKIGIKELNEGTVSHAVRWLKINNPAPLSSVDAAAKFILDYKKKNGAYPRIRPVGECKNHGKIHATIKPPLGLRPKKVADIDRAKEILIAMMRRLDAGMDIPVVWTDEIYSLLHNSLNEQERK